MCGDGWLVDLVSGIHMAGFIVGALLGGVLSDKYKFTSYQYNAFNIHHHTAIHYVYAVLIYPAVDLSVCFVCLNHINVPV